MSLPLSPRTIDLPFDTWRRGQRPTLRTLLAGEGPRDTMVQAPTGSGKSTLVAGLMRLARGRTFALTATKNLQAQYNKTFPWLTDIRGMGNYECLAARDEFSTWFPFAREDRTIMCDVGPCRSGASCGLKEGGCTYFDKLRAALASQSVLTNYSYWLSMRRYGRGLGPVDTLMCDEAHALPEELMGAFALSVPTYLDTQRGPEYAFGKPELIAKQVEYWRGWAARRIDELKHKAQYGASELHHRRNQTLDTLEKLTQIDDTWCWERRGKAWTFEPVKPALLLPALATDATVTHRVYLSATVTLQSLAMVGIDTSRVNAIYLPSQFALSRRPVYVVDAPRVDHYMSDTAKTYWVSQMDKIIRNRLDRKGIIHSVSYKRALDIKAASKYGGIMLAPRSASELSRALDIYDRASSNMILISPSLTTGLDFPHDRARYQIICKMFLPDTQSLIARARMAATPNYRDHLAGTTLVQAIGRVVRDEEDWGETFIVDLHAKQWALRVLRPFIPDYVWDAISYPQLVPLPPPLNYQFA